MALLMRRLHRQIFAAAGSDFRFQTLPDKDYDDLDNADNTNAKAWVGIARTDLRQVCGKRVSHT